MMEFATSHIKEHSFIWKVRVGVLLLLAVMSVFSSRAIADNRDAQVVLSHRLLLDPSGQLSVDSRRKISSEQEDVFAKTGVSIHVALLGDKQREPLEDYASRLVLERKLFVVGDKGSALFVIDTNPAAAVLLVSEALELRVPASLQSFVVSHGVLPKLEQGGVEAGVLTGIDILRNLIAPAKGKPLGSMPVQPLSFWTFILPLVFVALVFGYWMDRLMEFAFGNSIAAIVAGVLTYLVVIAFVPQLWAVVGGVVSFLVALFDVFGGHEPVVALHTAREAQSKDSLRQYHHRKL